MDDSEGTWQRECRHRDHRTLRSSRMADQRLVGGLHREEKGCRETAQRGKHFLTHRRRDNVPDPKWHGNLRAFTRLVLQRSVDYHNGEEEREIRARHFEHSPCVRLSRLVENPHAARYDRQTTNQRSYAIDRAEWPEE